MVRHCDSGNKVLLVCYMIYQDHVIKGLCDLMERSLPSFATMGIVVVEFDGFTLSHDLARPYDQRVLMFLVRGPLCKSPPCQIWWPEALR